MRPGPWQLGTAGAVQGDVLTYDEATDEYVPAAPVAPVTPGTSIDDVVVTVTNGVPMLLFDADSTPVTTEVPS